MTQFQRVNVPAIFTKSYGDVRQLDNDMLKALSELSINLDSILNQGMRFEDNVDCRLVEVTSHATPGTEFSVSHGLGKVPTGYVIYRRDGAGTVYDGTSADTATTLFLRSDASSVTFKLIVF